MAEKRIPRRYYALHEAGLQNGSFYRVSQKACGDAVEEIVAQYINGDFMGRQDALPDKYCGMPLKEFSQTKAERLVPRCCL